MKEKIIDCVKTVLVTTLKLPVTEDLQLTTRLKEDLGLDSMSSLLFLMGLEDAIPGFVVNPDSLQADNLFTIDTISEYIFQEMSTLCSMTQELSVLGDML